MKQRGVGFPEDQDSGGRSLTCSPFCSSEFLNRTRIFRLNSPKKRTGFLTKASVTRTHILSAGLHTQPFCCSSLHVHSSVQT